MDMVPKNKRGMWNSLEGLTAFTWTGKYWETRWGGT